MIGEIFGFGKTLLSWFKDRSKAKQELKMAEIKAKTQIVLSENTANSEWELAQLTDKDKLIRWAAFLLFASPLISYWISPRLGDIVMMGWHKWSHGNLTFYQGCV